MTELFVQPHPSAFIDHQEQEESPLEGLDPNISKLYEVVTEGKKHRFYCKMPDCTKNFRFKSEIERHISAHSDYRPHKCTFPDCQRSFKRLDALENHVRSQHTGEAPLYCPHPDCGKNFTTNAKLRYHMLLHLDEKPYKCSIDGCDRSFVTLSQLKQHENSSSVHKKIGAMANKKKKTKEDETGEVLESEPVERVERVEKVDMNQAKKKIKIATKIEPVVPRREPEYHEMPAPEHPMELINAFEHDLNEQIGMMNAQANIFEGKHVLTHVLSENEVLKNKLEQTTNLLNVIKTQMNQFANFRPEDIQQMMIPKVNNPVINSIPFKSLESKGAFHFHQKPPLESLLWDNNGLRDQLFGNHFKDMDLHMENIFDKASDLYTGYNMEENQFMHFE